MFCFATFRATYLVMVDWIKTDYLPEASPKLPRKTLPFIFYFLKQAWPGFVMVAILSGTADIIGAFIPYYIKLIVDAFSENQDAPAQVWEALKWPLISFVGLVLILKPVSERSGAWLMSYLRPAFTNMMCRQLALYMHKHSYNYFQNDFAGRLASKVIETPNAIAGIVQTTLGTVWMSVIRMMIALTLFSITHWVFGVICAAWIAAYALLAWIYVPRIINTSKTMYNDRSIVRGRYVDTLTNIMTVKLFAREEHEDQYLLESLKNTTRSGQKMLLTNNAKNIWAEVLIAMFLGSSFIAAIMLWEVGAITTGDAAMAIPLALSLTNLSTWMIHVLASFFENIGQVREGMETILKGQDVQDTSGAAELDVKNGEISIQNIGFKYTDDLVFDDLDISIGAGEKVGLIGPSGAGKTTLISLLLRLFDVQDGQIQIDGQDIRNVTQKSLREQIAVIPQSASLLHRSVRENIAFGNPEATDEQIIAAAEKANAHEFITSLKDNKGRTGYDALIGERGVKLSGGQRQRIAIARAILKDAPILILDEATSSLDSESEHQIQSALEKLMDGKTVIAIAHRLSTINHLDRLLVMDEGKIVEDGHHEKLIQNDGLYKKLWAMQSGGFLPKSWAA